MLLSPGSLQGREITFVHMLQCFSKYLKNCPETRMRNKWYVPIYGGCGGGFDYDGEPGGCQVGPSIHFSFGIGVSVLFLFLLQVL